MQPWFVVLLAALGAPSVAASPGDRLPEFKACVSECVRSRCPAEVLPRHLRLLHWDCPSNCDYLCQRSLTRERCSKGLEAVQFHGKWPFQRFLGIQEPMSVLFSILNFMAHYRGMQYLSKRLPKNFSLRPYYFGWGFLGLNAWVWSAVFHTRDFLFTERADYFAAGASVMYGLFYAVIRIFRLDLRWKPLYVYAWGLLCLAAFLFHVSYLSFVTFDYGYNMLANVVVGAIQHIVWTYYSISNYRSRPAWALWPAIIVALLACAMSLEIWDFPPVLDALDAHALWHASTPLLTSWWYAFLAHDADYEYHSKQNKM